MITQSTHMASYHATDEEWEALASWLETKGEKRLARTIRDGIESVRRREKWRNQFNWSHHTLRFRDGSISKINDAIDNSCEWWSEAREQALYASISTDYEVTP